MSFVHLHVHSQFSLLEATCRFKELVEKCKDSNMPALAITDYGNMFGAVEFYFAAKSAGVKPIIGLEVYLAPKGRLIKGEDRDNRTPNTRLVLLAKNLKGYQNLCQISSIGYKEGFYYRPRVDYEILEKFSDNLIVLSGGLMGEVPWNFINKGEDVAIEKIQKLKNIYAENFYLEICRTQDKEWQSLEPFLVKASRDMNIPLVATNNVHYTNPGDQVAQEVLICIGSNKTLQDESRFKLGSDQYYFKSAQEMQKLFQDIPEAVNNTLKIADQCNVEFQLKDKDGNQIYHLPTYPTETSKSLKEEIRNLSFQGLEDRIKEKIEQGEEFSEEQKLEYGKRIDYELGVIDGMGFNGYFLIVQDFINWAKENNIPVGPGRGSGAGSLVAFCLKITDLDPMPYALIFERFLNPERVSMPDFDIDFCQENRGRVIQYVTDKYGEESVSQIITYGRLQCKAAIRDVGRVMGMTFGEVDVISKLIPEKLGITIQEAIDTEPRLREMMDADPKVSTLIDLAKKIEGLVRHAGIHAAGVVIADGSIVLHAPLYKGAEDENVVQYDMKHAEKIGLIKFDFLGLKTLTHIQNCFELIEKNRQKKIKTQDISLSDKGIYELMSRGDTDGVFQFESDGMKDLLKKAKPECFEDIVALNALYRPGPMEMIPSYLDRKHGRKKVKYIFPELEPILKETYGITVYQEHVQLIAAKIANYSLGEADMLRRAMGKKIAEEMAKQKKRFLSGAKENKYDEKKAEELFDTMAEFAKYGFNKSHAAAYCVVTAYTAFLKHYFPTEFYAALLSTEMSDTDKIVKYVKDAKTHGLEVKPPHINLSDYKFSVDGDDIFFSLGAIKGVGQAAVESILEARSQLPNQSFESLEQFFEKVDLRKVNKKTIESLIKAGAFDEFADNRAQLMSGYAKFIEHADRVKRDQEVGQGSLFAMDATVQEQEKITLDSQPPWRRSERLANEKEVLGFYLSDHPLKGVGELAQKWTNATVKQLDSIESKKKVFLVGMIASMREIITKKGTRMAFCQLEDMTGTVELVVFPNTFAECEMVLKSEGALLVTGNLEANEDSKKIICEKVMRLEDQLRQAKKVVFKINKDMQNKLERLKLLLSKHPGETSVLMEVDLPDIAKNVHFALDEPKGITPSPEFIEGVYSLFGDTNNMELRLH